MPRIITLVAWLGGATVSAVAYWYVVVYVLDDFNHGYGRIGWFALKVYMDLLAGLAGLIGCVAVVLVRGPTWSFAYACTRGVLFTLCELLWGFALGELYPDRDIAVQTIAGALVIGPLTFVVPWPGAHRAAE